MTYIVTGIDIETTGLAQEEGHRIIEIALASYATLDGITFNKVGKTWCQRINPLRSIDAGAQLVHGISLSDLKNEPEWEEVAPKVNTILKQSSLLVAHNISFDAPFVALELVRAGFNIVDIDTFCTMENGRPATPMGTVPNLGDLCWAFLVPYDGDSAHAADYDIDVTMECFFRGLKSGIFKVPSLLNYTQRKQVA